MSSNKNRKKVLDIWNNKNNKHITPYKIHINTGISFQEIQGYIAEDKEAKHRHKKSLELQRELEDTNIVAGA